MEDFLFFGVINRLKLSRCIRHESEPVKDLLRCSDIGFFLCCSVEVDKAVQDDACIKGIRLMFLMLEGVFFMRDDASKSAIFGFGDISKPCCCKFCAFNECFIRSEMIEEKKSGHAVSSNFAVYKRIVLVM